MTWTVLAFDLSSNEICLDRLLRGDAERFRPHITILPRIRTAPSILRDNLIEHFSERISFEIELKGPKEINHNLTWLECEIGAKGNSNIRAMHLQAFEIAARYGYRPSPAHCERNFRPHMTLRSGLTTGESYDFLPSRVIAKTKSLVFYEVSDLVNAPIERHPLF